MSSSRVAADQRREPALGGGVQARAAATRAQHLEGVHGRVPLDPLLAEVERLEEPADRPVRRFADQHAAGAGRLLEPRRDVRRVADRGVVHPQVVADAADDDRARVEADAHPEAGPCAGLELAAVDRGRALDAERGVDGPPRAVLVRDGRAEERHHAVARVLVDGALEAVDLGGDPLEAPVHDRVHVLGVELLGEAREPGDVGEEHGDLAALALERDRALRTLSARCFGV